MSLAREDVCATGSVGDGVEFDISSLLDMVGRVTERRGPQGRGYGEWLRQRAKPEPDGTMTVAIDGTVLRGAWTDENVKFTVFSAMIHGLGVTIAQVHLPAETNWGIENKATTFGM